MKKIYRILGFITCFSIVLAACGSQSPTLENRTAPVELDGTAAGMDPIPTQTAVSTAVASGTPEPFTQIAISTASKTPIPQGTTKTITSTMGVRVLELTDPPLEGNDVLRLQKALAGLGYGEVGEADGIFDRQTDAAVRHFQYLNGLAITGKVDTETGVKLNSSKPVKYIIPFPFPGMRLTNGSATCDETMLKTRLAIYEYMQPGQGDWELPTIGETTNKAMIEFLKKNGLRADGVMDWADWNVLYGPGIISASGAQLPEIPAEAAWTSSLFAFPGKPIDLAWDGKKMWVAVEDEDFGAIPMVVVVDPSQPPHMAVSAVKIGACNDFNIKVLNIQAIRDKVWVLYQNLDDLKPYLQSINVNSGLKSSPISFGDCSYVCFVSTALGYDGSHLWAGVNQYAYAFDPVSGSTLYAAESGYLLSGDMVYDGKECLYVNGEAGVVAFAASGLSCRSYTYGLFNGSMAWDGSRMWNAAYGQLMYYDPAVKHFSSQVEIPGGVDVLAVGGGRLWIAIGEENAIRGMDYRTGGLGEPIPVNGHPLDMEYTNGILWVGTTNEIIEMIDVSEYLIPQVTAVPTQTFTLIPTATITPTWTATYTRTSRPSATVTPDWTPTPTLPAFARDLYLTSPHLQGEDVLLLQQRLTFLGYNCGIPDGDFGSRTDEAVRMFQQNNNLVVDGWVGPITWNLLFSGEAVSP